MDKSTMVRVSFELTKEEAERLCAIRCEPKPSTAAAQVVRLTLKRSENAEISGI